MLLRRQEVAMARTETRVFRASLDGAREIYRDIEVEGTKSLYRLAEAIVGAFGFDFDHAFGFYAGTNARTMMRTNPRYELFADMGEDSDARSVKKTKVTEAFPEVGRTMTFLFDYGDDWRFRVKLIGSGQKAAKVRYPRVLASKGQAPEQYPDFG
jgi:hypothetical protein